MKRILFLFLVLSLVLTVAGCSSGGPDTRLLNADFEVVDNGSTISIQDKSTSDFDNVDYKWTLKFISENGEIVHEKTYNGKDLSFYKPNTKRAKLELSLLADGNMSRREKSVPTRHIPVVLDREGELLTAYFEDGADRWIMKDKSGNVIKEKNLDRKVDNVLFDLSDVTANSVIIKAYDGDWFLNQIHYSLDGSDDEDVSFSYTRKSETEYEFVASQPSDGKYWEWKLPDEDHWLVYEDQNRYTHQFDSSLVGQTVTVKLKIFDKNDNELGYTEKDIYLKEDSDDNSAPTLHSIGDKSVTEGNLLEFSVSGSDPDDDSLTYSASNLPSGASFSNKTFSWHTDSNDSGSYDVTFKVSDGELTDKETITINVNEESSGVSFDYNRLSEGQYEFVASEPSDGKYWEWKFPENTYWEGYADQNTITHNFDSNLIGNSVTVKLRILDSNENEIGTYEETFVVD